jgi:mono/diheme cytochrome c family protein
MQMASSAPSGKPLTAPMDIFKANCARCHVIGPVGRAGGISLDHVGKKKTQAWIETQIRDPASHHTPMPPFAAAQLPDSEMHILAHYLAGLK